METTNLADIMFMKVWTMRHLKTIETFLFAEKATKVE